MAFMDKSSSEDTSAQSSAEATPSPNASASAKPQAPHALDTTADNANANTAETVAQETPAASPEASPFAIRPEGANASKKLSPTGIAILSLFMYPGAGQFYRKQFTKGTIMAVFFTAFLIGWGYMVAKGLFNLYGDMFIEPGTKKISMEMGVSYLKRSFIPGIAALAIYLHSAWDAYRG